MNLADLLDQLENANLDAELRVVCQPNHPVKSRVTSVVTDADDETGATVVRFCEGSWDGYASSAVWA